MVRADLLGVPRDAVGGGHRRDRRRVQPLVGAARSRSSAPSSTGTASTRRCVASDGVSAVCFALATAVFVTVDADELLRLSSPWFWVLVALHAARLGRRPDARDRPVDLRDAARPRRAARPGQRDGRHDHRCVVRDHLGVQRPRHRRARHGLGVLPRAGAHRSPRSSHMRTIEIDEPEPEPAAPDGERQPAVDIRGAIEAIRAVPGLTDADPAGRVQQPARRCVHGAAWTRTASSWSSVEAWGLLWGVISLAFIAGGLVVARFGLGSNPRAARPRRQPRQLDRRARSSPCGRRSCCYDRDDRLAGADPRDRGGRADGAAAVDPVRAAGPRLRVRPADRERGVAAHRVPDGAAGRDGRSCRS